MVVVFVASMLVGVVRQYPTYSNAWANLRAFTGGCGLADDVLVEPDTNDGFMTPLPGNYGPLGPLGGVEPVGFYPQRCARTHCGRGDPDDLPMPGTDYDWDAPDQAQDARASTGRRCRCPTASTRRGFRWRAPMSTAAQQQSRLASAWYQLPPPDDAHPLVVDHRGGHDHRQQRVQRAHRRPDRRTGVRAPGPGRRTGAGGRLVPVRPRADPVVAQPALRPRRRFPPTRSRCALSPRIFR